MSEEIYTLLSPKQPVNGSFFMPGSKSYTNRALVMSALAPGVSTLRYASESDDSRAMVEALRRFGVEVECGETALVVHGTGGELLPLVGTIDVGPAGTTMRFLIALSAAVEGADVVLRGSERMHQRPVGELVNALRSLGAEIDYLEREGCPPLRVQGRKLAGGTVAMEGSLSSQFFTAMLLIAPMLRDGLRLEVIGEQISRSYISMTLHGLKAFGVEVNNERFHRYTVAPDASLHPSDYLVEGDASGASYLWALAAISRGTVRVENIAEDSAQGDAQFPALLERMGCKRSTGEKDGAPWIEVSGAPILRSINVDMTLMPDTAQTLCVVAACAEGSTRITGLSTLKHKETDRLLAMKTELAKLGVQSEVSDDSIVVHGGLTQANFQGAEVIDTYDDHRMAMSFAAFGARYDGLRIREPSVVTKSFPNFWNALRDFGVTIE